MLDALVVGAGPAGAVAAWRLARTGARVLIVDRETFPRDKLCGDTLNPGAIALLESLPFDHSNSPLTSARRLAGMLVTGPHARIEARYGGAIAGRAITRRVLDEWLLSQAIAAGARFEPGVAVRGAITDETASRLFVRGVTLARRGSTDTIRMPAILTIAADGRSSALAKSLGIARHPPAPRRWAFGAYMTGVAGTSDLGEMHIRGRGYVGVAPIEGDVCNVCAVTGPRPAGRNATDIVLRHIASDARLAARFADARFVSEVKVLGPLALNADACGVAGLLLAGDAAGFIDPMTGDGLHLALRGALLAAEEAISALETGDVVSAPVRLTDARRRALGSKERFNRTLRRLVESRTAIELAGFGARLAPDLVRWAIRHAGDAA